MEIGKGTSTGALEVFEKKKKKRKERKGSGWARAREGSDLILSNVQILLSNSRLF